MSVPLNADDVFEIAEQVERNASAFYQRAAQETDDETLGKKLRDLAAMESIHEKVLSEIRSTLTSQETDRTLPEPWGEAVLYLRGIADAQVFGKRQDPAEWLAGCETKEDLLNLAIGHEKDSIVFYLGMKEIVPQELGKERLDTIIKEEMGHITMLTSELARPSA